jgi:hypothetical protein
MESHEWVTLMTSESLTGPNAWLLRLPVASSGATLGNATVYLKKRALTLLAVSRSSHE